MNRFYIFLLPLIVLILSCSTKNDQEEKIPFSERYLKDPNTEYLEILAYGDFGHGNYIAKRTGESMVSYATSSDIDFIINLGDSFYPDGVSSVDDILWLTHFESMFDTNILYMPFFSVFGNHDYRGNIQAQLDYISPNNDRWKMPARYYLISKTLSDGTAIDFFFIDTESLISGDSTQLLWLKNHLYNSDADWKVVSGHRVIISNGHHGSSLYLKNTLYELFNSTVDIYLSGHDHDLQILKEESNTYYLINGSSSDSRDTSVKNSTILATSRNGFMSLIFSKNEIICNVFESSEGIIFTTILKNKQ